MATFNTVECEQKCNGIKVVPKSETVPKLVPVSFSGLERRMGCTSNDIGAEGSQFPNVIMGRKTEIKFQLGPLSFGAVYWGGDYFIHLFCKCSRAECPVPRSVDSVENDGEL